MKNYTKGIVVAVILTATFLFVWILYGSRITPQPSSNSLATLDQLEKGIPEFTLPDLAGKQYSITEMRGKVVLLNFWATWCAPCVEEFPSMIKLIEQYKGKIVLVTVAADERKEDVVRFVDALKLNHPHARHLWDPELKIAKQFGTARLPETYVLGPQLTLLKKIANSQDWSNPQAIQYFDSILKAE